MAKKQDKIDLEGLGFGEFEPPKPVIRPKRRGRRKPPARRNRRAEAYRKRAVQRHPTRTKTIKIGLEIKPEQSVRGTFEAGDFVRQDSIIIHFIHYDITIKNLVVQLTIEGNWQWYTYFNVSPQAAADFKDAPSKGQHFNRFIRNTKKHGFHYSFTKGRLM